MSQSQYKNSVFVEFGGAALTYSINYERTIFDRNNFYIPARIGFSTLGKSYAVPIGFSLAKRLNNNKSAADVHPFFTIARGREDYHSGLGDTSPETYYAWKSSFIYGVQFGYRYQPIDKHLFGYLRLILMSAEDIENFHIWAAIGIGYSFK